MALLGFLQTLVFICLPFPFFCDLNILCLKEIDFCDKTVTHVEFLLKRSNIF